MEKFWEKRIRVHEEHAQYRAIHLARCNPDYQRLHPQEAKQNPDRKLLKDCHPEARKRIHEECEKYQRHVHVPTVERPERLNR